MSEFPWGAGRGEHAAGGESDAAGRLPARGLARASPPYPPGFMFSLTTAPALLCDLGQGFHNSQVSWLLSHQWGVGYRGL